jgi:hypothetical protein
MLSRETGRLGVDADVACVPLPEPPHHLVGSGEVVHEVKLDVSETHCA